MIRPEARARLWQARDLFVVLAVVALGLWFLRLGGYLLVPVGAAVIALGLGLALLALRRLRFARPTTGPGLVEVDEGQVGYLGPMGGGYVSLRELAELRLLSRGGARFWLLKQMDGQALLIPADAQGADQLFDAFASLPGLGSDALVAALEKNVVSGEDSLGPVIWRHPTRANRIATP